MQPGAAHRRVHPVQGRGHHPAVGPRPEGRAPQHPDGLPGPLHLPEPPDDGGRHRGGAVRDPPRGGPQGGPAPAGAGTAGRGGARPGLRQPLPAPVLRRPAPAHRHRAGARAAPGGHRRRRAGVRPGRLRAGAGDQPAGPAPDGVRPVLRVHRARPVDRAAHLGPGRGDVPGPDRGDGTGRGDLRPPDAPVHPGAAVGGAGPGPRGPRTPRADHPRRRRALAHGHPLRVPLPHPVLEGAGAVRPRGAGPRGARGVREGRGADRARLGVPFRRGAAGGAAGGPRWARGTAGHGERQRAGVTRTPARARHPHGRMPGSLPCPHIGAATGALPVC
ncbi:Oligopeptide transport ATP-binding protein OppF [Streptomyces misionensis JCM 4497]